MSNTYAPCPQCEAINRVPLGRAEAEVPICGNCKAALEIQQGIVRVNGTSLQHLVDRLRIPIVTDFWAPWCVPCHAFEHEFQQAARRLGDRFVFTSMNTMEHAIAADTHRIRTLPTLVVFRNGGEVDRHFGAISQEALVQWLNGVATTTGPESQAA